MRRLFSYNEHFFALDPFVDLPSGQVVTLDEFIPEDERHQSEYFQQFLAPINVHHILGTDIYTPRWYQMQPENQPRS
nr:hypothetical protein [Endozoicomonas sp.]